MADPMTVVEQVPQLLNEGSFTATYKYAVLLGLVELCVEGADNMAEIATPLGGAEILGAGGAGAAAGGFGVGPRANKPKPRQGPREKAIASPGAQSGGQKNQTQTTTSANPEQKSP